MDELTTRQLDHIIKNIVASAILHEAGRIADSHAKGRRISAFDLQAAAEEFLKALEEMRKQGL